MTPVIWTEQAFADLGQIRKYIARDRPLAADLLIDRILGAVERLVEYPRSGRTVREAEDPAIREVIVGGYRVIHRVREDRVVIWRVFHSSRQLKPEHLRHMP